MKTFLACFALLAVQAAAIADTTQSTPVLGNYTLKRGTTTVVTTAGTMLDCEARARADAQSRAASAKYTCTSPETFTVTYTAAPVQCASQQPPDDTQQATCPAGTYGTFTQTRSYIANPSPTCWQPGAWSPTTPAPGVCGTTAPNGSYATTFDGTENPISEGGRWYRSNNPWTNVRTGNGIAYGTNGVTNQYDDSYALLSGAFGPDQTIEAVIQRDNTAQGETHEVELLLRFSDDNNNARGYECLFNWAGGVQVVRWNGGMGNFTVINTNQVNYFSRPLVTGDTIKASIVGSVISLYINGQLIVTASDTAIASGQPGMAFFVRPGGSTTLLALTSYSVTSK